MQFTVQVFVALIFIYVAFFVIGFILSVAIAITSIVMDKYKRWATSRHWKKGFVKPKIKDNKNGHGRT